MSEIQDCITTLKTHGVAIIIGMMMGAVLALCVTLFQSPVYRAEMIVGPTDRTGVPSLSNMLPRTAADSPALHFFAERIDASHATDFTVFETRMLKPSVIEQINGQIFPSDAPVAWAAKHIKIKPAGLTPFRKVTVESADKDKLIPILNNLYQVTDQSVRQDARTRAQRRITYLNQKFEETLNPSHREAIIALLKEQEQIAMMASIDHEFAARIIEPAHVITKPVAPNWKILFPALIAVGGFMGLIVSGFRKTVS